MNRLEVLAAVIAFTVGCGTGGSSSPAAGNGGSGSGSAASAGSSTNTGGSTSGGGSIAQSGAPGTSVNNPTGAGTGSGAAAADLDAGVADMDGDLADATVQATEGGATADGAAGGAPSCSSLPPVTDYSAQGPFTDVMMFTNVGPSSNYTLFRPTTSLGQNGFKHPVATWGNGILTNPSMYQKTLPLIASHGFVIIACNDDEAEEPCLSAGMDWLIQQNTTSGPMQGKLDTTNEVVIGYSWGGGAAIDTSVRPNVKATASLHGMPPRQTGTWDMMHAPLLLTTSTGDDFVTASGYVTPNYNDSKVQTFYATLDDSTVGHLYVVDVGAGICIGSVLGKTFGACGSDIDEHALTIAWLRLWACGDTNAKKFFYGDDCVLCQSPWENPQRKDWQ
jgi:hypothetical protein